MGGDIILNGDITAGNTIGLVATGQGNTAGNIDASAGAVTLTAPNTSDPAGAFIAQNAIQESTNITLSFGGGEVDVATGDGNDVEFFWNECQC